MAELTIHHRGAIEALNRRWGRGQSSHAFPSLWLWREQLGLELLLTGECYALRAALQGKNAWFFPCGSEAGKLAFLRRLGEPGVRLLYLGREDAHWLQTRFPGQWELRRRPDWDEYLYERTSHVEMAGGRFRHLRWRAGRIQRDLSPRTELLDGSNLPHARQIRNAWAGAHPAQGGDDRQVTLRALERREDLGLHGVIVYLAERPAAFMMGFPLAEDTFDAAVGKWAADVQGLTYYVLRELMLSLPERYRWFNLEEDLGLPGLRDMKEHFLPDGKHEMWEARRL